MTLGNKIAHYRKKLNITQDALAQKLGVTNQAVSKWESDQCCPDVMLLPELADIFSISMDELFDRKPSNTEKTFPVAGLPWQDDGILRVALYIGCEMIAGGQAKPGLTYCTDRDVAGVISPLTVSCGDVSGNVDAGGGVNCGNVGGSVDAGSHVNCGNVDGSVDAGSDVNCGNIGGNLDAGCDVNCGNVGGNVDAGCDVTCGDVAGDVDAGCSVECGTVCGDIDACGPVTIRK